MNKKLLQELDSVISKEYDNWVPTLQSIATKYQNLISSVLKQTINWEIVDNWVLEYYIKNFKYFKKIRLNFLSAYPEIKWRLDNQKSIQLSDFNSSNYQNDLELDFVLNLLWGSYKKIAMLRLEWYSHTMIMSLLWISRRVYYKKIKHMKELINNLFFNIQ